MSMRQLAEFIYMYELQVIADARAASEQLLQRKPREEVEYDYSFADKYFSIFN